MQTVKLRHPDGTETNVVKGVMMLEAADLVPTFPDHFFAQGKSKEEAVSATQSAAQGEPAAQPENTVTQSESTVTQSSNSAQPENTAAQPDEGAELSSLVPPRSFASLQLRAKNATKALFAQKREHLLVLCSDTSVDGIATAVDLVREVQGLEPTVAYAPTKFEFFGNDKEDGIITAAGADGLNVVVMPCTHLIDHPK